MALGLYVFWALTWLVWVLLALAPTQNTSPEWLLLTREVCFGSLPERLPSAQGWISLAAPIPMLVALLAVYGSELRKQLVRVSRPMAVSLLLLPLFTVGYATVRVVQELPRQSELAASPPLSPDYPELGIDCPEFSLQDQHGQPFGKEGFKNQVTVVTFAYAHCETVCPALLETFRRLQGVNKVVVTLDPWRDTCGNLSGIASSWDLGPETLVLSGEPGQVAKLTEAWSVPVSRDELTGEIFHPALVFILGTDGKVLYGFTNPTVAWLEEGVRRAQRS